MLRSVHFVVRLPRVLRVVIATLFALAATLAISPLVDTIYTEWFFSAETVILPALISAALGLTMYVLGWWLIVGTVGEQPEARRAIVWYCGIGLFAILTIAFLIIRGVSLVRIWTGS
jgi:hypothetical protein